VAVAARIVRPNQSLIVAKIDNDTVLLDLDTGVYFGLDEVGTRIWDLLCEGAIEDEIVDRLGEEYDAEPEQLRADLHDFVEQLHTRGLVLDSDD
jgi:hypothetical protein